MATEFVRTFARVRPSAGTDRPVIYVDGKTIVSDNGKKMTFDGAYGPESQQTELFDSVGRKIIEGAIDGISGTIFAYGQTGSGKTFTMMGPSRDGEFLLEGDDRGLIPRCVSAAFGKLEEKKHKMGSRFDFKVFCTFVEIYNENTRDLLSDNHHVTIRADQRITLDGATREEVASDVDALRLVQQGLCARQVGQTAMNNQSSRSHAIFIMEIDTEETEDGVSSRRQSRVCMVDLAGSERQKSAQTAGQQLKEASGINNSLTTLARVIRILAEKAEQKYIGHVPFRDSRLTLLLRDSLGGNSRTAVVVALHPGPQQESESRSTLQFAECCKKIKNKTVANKTVSGVSIVDLQTRIARLEEANDELTKGKEAVELQLANERQRYRELEMEKENQEARMCQPSPSRKARRRTSQHERRFVPQPATSSLWDDDAALGEDPMDTTVTLTSSDLPERQTLVKEVDRLKKIEEGLRAQVKDLEEKLQAAASEGEDVIDDLETSQRAALAEKDNIVNELEQRLREAQQETGRSQLKIADLETSLSHAKEHRAQLEERLVDSAQKMTTVVDEKRALEGKIVEANDEAMKLAKLLEASNKKCCDLSNEKGALETKLRDIERQLTIISGKKAELEASVIKERQESEASLANVIKEKKELEAQLADVVSSKTSKKKVNVLQSVIDERDRLKEEIKELKKKPKNTLA